jgi:integrase
VYRDKTRGGWVGMVVLDPTPDGKRRRKLVRARSERAAWEKVRDVLAKRDQGLPTDGDQRTTGAFLDHWATHVLPRSVAPATAANYQTIVRAYIDPHVGRIRLAQLRPVHVERMMSALEADELAPRTVALARTVLRRALTVAQRQHLVASNAAALTDAPRKQRAKTDDVLDETQVRAVLDTARGDRLEALAVLVLAVGLRQGEVRRLRWGDVNLPHATLKVRAAKTDAGIRTIPLPRFVVTALHDHRARQNTERLAAAVWADTDLAFTTSVGTMLDSRNLLRWWHDLTTRAGVGRRRFHASRHTAATLMLNNGVPLEIVSATLGHAGLAITADVYAKVGSKLQRTAADAMQDVLGR